MEDRGVIRIDPRQEPDPAPRWSIPLAALTAILAIGALLVVGGGGDRREAVPEQTIPDLGPDPVEAALLTVEEFAVSWNSGDAAAAQALIADDWDRIELPGFLDSLFTPFDGREELAEGIGFLSSVTRLNLDSCTASFSSPDSRATAVVSCPDGRFEGDYLDALGHAIPLAKESEYAGEPAAPQPGIEFALSDDGIIGIEADASSYDPQAYCIWAGRERPAVVSTLFDLRCYPVTVAASGAGHAEASAGFVAAGAPLPSVAEAEARLSASYVARFVEHHNDGEPFAILRWLSPQVDPSGLPGFAGATEPPNIVDYLEWSARLIDIDPGRCSVELLTGFTVVTCNEMTVRGLLAAEPLPQPTRFTLLDSMTRRDWGEPFERILAIERLSDSQLSVTETCRELQDSHPETAERVFTDECLPVYARAMAAELARLIEQS